MGCTPDNTAERAVSRRQFFSPDRCEPPPRAELVGTTVQAKGTATATHETSNDESPFFGWTSDRACLLEDTNQTS